MMFDMKLYLTEQGFVESQMNNNLFERADGYYIRFLKANGRNKMVVKNRKEKYNHICSCIIPESMSEADMLFYLLEL